MGWWRSVEEAIQGSFACYSVAFALFMGLKDFRRFLVDFGQILPPGKH